MIRRLYDDIRDLQADERRSGLLAVVRSTSETAVATDSVRRTPYGRASFDYSPRKYEFFEYHD